MSKTVASVIDEVAGLLNDREEGFEHVRWSEPDLLEYLNDAIMQAYIVRPQLFSVRQTMDLVPGARQVVPDGCNLQRLSVSDKPARIIDENLLAIYGGLDCKCSCTGDGKYQVDGFSFNANDPGTFYVDPPVPDDGETHTADLTCMHEPDEITAQSDGSGGYAYSPENLPIKAKLHNAVVEWMLYRAYSVDMESGQSDKKMALHLRHFYEMLGLDAKITDKLMKDLLGKSSAQTPTANVGGNG